MPPRKLTPVQVLERLQKRVEKRMEALQRVKLDGYGVAISELETKIGLPAAGEALFGRVI
jgi:hypothetical protein